MKNYLKAVTLILLSLTVMAFVGPTKVKFLSADWSAAQQKAKAEKKLYFVDFDASYCASCRNMDASTYQDPALASFMENNVVALRLDVQDFEGAMWSQNYEVEALPTMLIFNQDGKLVKRIVGYKSAKDLMAAFSEVLPKKDIKTETVKPVEQKLRIGNPGGRALPKADVIAFPVQQAPEPHRPLGKVGTELWERVWLAAAAWLKPQADAESVLLLCEASDERTSLRYRVMSDPDAWRERKALRDLE
jgi:thioredoxin-related protein